MYRSGVGLEPVVLGEVWQVNWVSCGLLGKSEKIGQFMWYCIQVYVYFYIVCFRFYLGHSDFFVPIMSCSHKDWLDFWNTFLFPLDRTLIISENRKCGEGLPDGQQKNTIYSKKATFPHHKRKKKKRKKTLLNKHIVRLRLGLSHKKTALYRRSF